MTIFGDGFVAFQLDLVELFEVKEFVVFRKIRDKILHMSRYFVGKQLIYCKYFDTDWEYINISNHNKASNNNTTKYNIKVIKNMK